MWVDEGRQGQSSGFRDRFSDQAISRTVQYRGWTMTTGMMGNDEGLLTEQDVVRVLEVSLSTLRRWQREGTGPPCLEIGRQVRYRQAAVERWSTGSMQAGSPYENRCRA
jgi:predicted DNA-binding transcriptional regulator AlpA